MSASETSGVLLVVSSVGTVGKRHDWLYAWSFWISMLSNNYSFWSHLKRMVTYSCGQHKARERERKRSEMMMLHV